MTEGFLLTFTLDRSSNQGYTVQYKQTVTGSSQVLKKLLLLKRLNSKKKPDWELTIGKNPESTNMVQISYTRYKEEFGGFL